ncbi:MAG: hypothetical protein Q7V63_06920 [Gammaproteobacteria bacterium]|nr:hypothetical protein [Gammaproteobacteria bacterium]
MKLRLTVISMCLLGMATAGTAMAATNNTSSAQIRSLQKQLNRLQMKVNNLNSNSTSSFKGLSNVVSLNSNLTSQMMSNYSSVGREMNLLNARQNGSLANQSLTIGGEAQADALHQHTNNPGYFSNPIANTTGASTTTNPTNNHVSSVGNLNISNLRLGTAVALNDMATGYVQVGSYNLGNTQLITTGSSTDTTTVGSNTLNIQDAYLVLGNLAKNPVYGFVGKKDIDFGSFASVQPYSQPLTRIFMANGNTAGVGYTSNGLNITGSIMNGGTNNNVESVGNIVQYQNLYTQNGNGINNYAVNTSYSNMTSGVNWTLGAGYLNGSRAKGYSAEVGGKTTAYSTGNNGAWDLNAKASVNNFDLLAEYVSTVHTAPSMAIVPVSGSSTVFPNAIISAMSIGGDYKFMNMGYNSVAALSYSKAGQGHSAWNAYQYVASYRVQPFSSSNVWAGVEYAYSKGLVGGSLAGVTTLTNGDTVTGGSSAVNNTVVLDVTAFF